MMRRPRWFKRKPRCSCQPCPVHATGIRVPGTPIILRINDNSWTGTLGPALLQNQRRRDVW